jgi:hypothetical protein
VPEPKAGEVLIKVEAASLNRADLSLREPAQHIHLKNKIEKRRLVRLLNATAAIGQRELKHRDVEPMDGRYILRDQSEAYEAYFATEMTRKGSTMQEINAD